MSVLPRDATIDIAKGLAIIAIVLGHVLRGLASSGLIDSESSSFVVTDRFLYTFHLSVFALVAALFISRSVSRDGPGMYLRFRDVTFVYLYVVWSLIQGAVKLLTGAVVNTPTSPWDVLALWIPVGQMWFLPWLVLMTTVAVLVRPWRRRSLSVVVVMLALVVSAAAWGISGTIIGTQGLGLTVFFFAGAVLGADRFVRVLDLIRVPYWGVIATVSLAVCAASVLLTSATPPTFGGAGRTVVTVALGFVASWAGVIWMIACARLLSTVRRRTEWLAFIGQRSLEIFLAHIVAASGARIILDAVGVQNSFVHIVLGTVAGVTFPLLLWWVCRRLSISGVLDAPPVLTGARKPRR